MWASTGGEITSFWQRLYFVGIAMALLAIQTLRAENKLELIKINSAHYVSGINGGILAALVIVVLIYFTRQNPTLHWSLLKTHFLNIAFLSLIVFPANEILFRGVLNPLWGFWSVAFLDAVNWTIATQCFGLFWIMLTTAALIDFLYLVDQRRFIPLRGLL
jgi:hypothetical protein